MAGSKGGGLVFAGRINRQDLWHFALILLAAAAVYAFSLGSGFIYDDYPQIVENVWLRDAGHLVDIFSNHVWGFRDSLTITNYYRPLMHVANFVIYSLAGPTPFPFHLLSLLLHLLNSLLLYVVIARLQSRLYTARKEWQSRLPLVAALFFAVYPANVEAVVWLGALPDLLYVFFSLTAISFYLKAATANGREQWVFLAASACCYGLAMLSKETAVPLVPAFMVLFEWASRHNRKAQWFKPLLLRGALFGGVLTGYLALRIGVLGSLIPIRNYGFEGWLKYLGFAQRGAWYLGQLAWPFEHNFYPQLTSVALLPATAQAGCVMLVLLGAAVLCWIWSRQRLLLVSSVFMVIPLWAALQNYALKTPVAERYLYLPAAGYSLMLAWGVLLLSRHSRPLLGYGVVCCMVVLFGGFSLARSLDFADGLTLWQDTVAKSPKAVDAREWLAHELFTAGHDQEAIAQGYRALELGSRNADLYYRMGLALQRSERLVEAQRIYQRMLQDFPADYTAMVMSGRVRLLLGDVPGAMSDIERALQVNADDGVAWYLLGCAEQIAGRSAEADAAYAAARRQLLDDETRSEIELAQCRAFED